MKLKVLVAAGDGIGPEVTREAVRVLVSVAEFGGYDFQFTEAEAAGLARYLQRGGMLVASSAAGLKPFDKAFKRELKKVFANAELIKLPPTHALFSGGWNPVERVTYTPAALRDNPTLTKEDHQSVKEIQGQVHLAQAAITGMRRFVRAESDAEKKSSH